MSISRRRVWVFLSLAILASGLVGACGSAPLRRYDDVVAPPLDARDSSVPAGYPIPRCPLPYRNAFAYPTHAPAEPGNDTYVYPAAALVADARTSVLAAVRDDAAVAVEAAAAAGYRLCTDQGVVVWQPLGERTGAPVFAWHPQRVRPVILEAPHPFFESGTALETLTLFEGLHARAMIVSGTDRCASAEPTSCEGVTQVCGGGWQSYRASDVAHNDDCLFHALHVLFAELFAEDLVVSVHGMAASGATFSDGTHEPTDGSSPVARLVTRIQDTYPEMEVRTCNRFDGAEQTTAELCGETNVQGRQLNGSPDACQAPATAASQRFVHLEQSLHTRFVMDVVHDALRAVVPRED